MSVSTTSGASCVDRRQQAIEVGADPGNLDVGFRLEETGDRFSHEVVVLRDDYPNGHGGRLRDRAPRRLPAQAGSLAVDANSPRVHPRPRRLRCRRDVERASRRRGHLRTDQPLHDRRHHRARGHHPREGDHRLRLRFLPAPRDLPQDPGAVRLSTQAGIRPRVPDRRALGDRHRRGLGGLLGRRRRPVQADQDRRSRQDDHRRAPLRDHLPGARRVQRVQGPRRAGVERNRDRVVGRDHRRRRRRPRPRGHDEDRMRPRQLRLQPPVRDRAARRFHRQLRRERRTPDTDSAPSKA